MKKRILILLIILLLTTGCTCEYNLTIDGNTYKEEINLYGQTQEETSAFKNDWKIPVNKDEYNALAGSDSEYSTNSETYEYKLYGSNLKFNYDFTAISYKNSTAVSNCYDRLSVSSYNDSIIISTSIKNNCFDKYPPLSSLKINITTNKEVVSNNADKSQGNTYTWNITKENASDKSINLVLKENDEESTTTPSEEPKQPTKNFNIDNYILYIFLGIIVLLIYLGYKWFMKFKEKNNNINEDE